MPATPWACYSGRPAVPAARSAGRAEDRIAIRVAPDKTWTSEHVEKVKRVVSEEVSPEVHTEVEVKEVLERPGGGKLKIVVIEAQ